MIEKVSDILELNEANGSLKDTLKPLSFTELKHIKNSSKEIVLPRVQNCVRKRKVIVHNAHVSAAKSMRRKEKCRKTRQFPV